MVHESLWRRWHNMVFRWSLVLLKWLCELPEYTHMGNRTPSWDSLSSAPFGKDRRVVCNLQASHNRSNFLSRDIEYCSLSRYLQRICGSTWWWRAPKRLFQQDGATWHTSNESKADIESFFDDRIISKALWPPRSPDLSSPAGHVQSAGSLVKRYSVILSVLDPIKYEYLKDYSLDFEHAYMTTYLASWEARRY